MCFYGSQWEQFNGFECSQLSSILLESPKARLYISGSCKSAKRGLSKVVIRILAWNTLLDHWENAFCGLFLELVRADSKLCRKLRLSFQAKRNTFHLTFAAIFHTYSSCPMLLMSCFELCIYCELKLKDGHEFWVQVFYLGSLWKSLIYTEHTRYQENLNECMCLVCKAVYW